VLATPVVLWNGLLFFRKSWLSLTNDSPNMYTLIGIGVAPAYLFSLVTLFLLGAFPSSLRTPTLLSVSISRPRQLS